MDLWDVNTTSQKVRSDDNADLTRSEFLNHLVTLLRRHVTENDTTLEALAAHHLVQAVSVALCVDEDHCLCHLANVKDLLDEVRLLARFTSELKLLDMIE